MCVCTFLPHLWFDDCLEIIFEDTCEVVLELRTTKVCQNVLYVCVYMNVWECTRALRDSVTHPLSLVY